MDIAKVDTLPAAWLKEIVQPRFRSQASVKQGGRNESVFRHARELRQRGILVVEARALLRQFNLERCDPPLPESEVETCLNSAWRYAPSYEMNELGNAKRFVAMVDGDVRYVIELKKFVTWNGSRWFYDESSLVCLAHMKESNHRIWEEIASTTDSDKQKAMSRFATSSQNTNRLKLALESVKSEPGIAISVHEFDSDPFLVGVLNGVIDLKRGEFRESRREDFVTKSLDCEYWSGSSAPLWERFLDEVMSHDRDLIEYLQRIVGYCLTGDTSEQVLFFAHGSGANGKSVFLETIKALLGDYGRNLRTEVLMVRSRSGGASEDEARLHGARYVTVNETSEGSRFNDSMIKDLTGGDTITARYLYQGSFEYRPTYKIVIRGNNRPAFGGSDGGMARRIRMIPFDRVVPESKRDARLPEKLRDELSGILNWALEGCLSWQRLGLVEPEAAAQATSGYVQEMDTVGNFLSEVCSQNPAYFESASLLRKSFSTWCDSNGVDGMSWKLVSETLKQRGFRQGRQRVKGKITRGWYGLKISETSNRVAPVRRGKRRRST